ncbi:MAG: KH domain-containing protein [Actinomycetota bacterium]|nr:KH domain-containing protein [Actinomycetota bacterium]
MSDTGAPLEPESSSEALPTADGAAGEQVGTGSTAPAVAGSTAPEGAEPAESEEPASLDDIAATAREFVSGLLEAMSLEATVDASVEPDRAVIEVNGPDLGVLIGRRGQTLDALQEVTRTAVQRRLRSRVRLLVDVEGYRSRRRASLAEYATAMATRAKERGTEIELEPMNAYERKIVHDAVAEVDGVSSFSEGEEPQRKVIVRGE